MLLKPDRTAAVSAAPTAATTAGVAASASPAPPRRLAVIASYAPSLLNFRGPLIRDVLARRCKVLCIAPDFTPEIRARLAALGAETHDWTLERTGLNPIADARSLKELTQILTAWQPAVVMGYTAKPAIYGALAARRAGALRVVPMITGLGYAFLDGQGSKGWLVQQATRRLYSRAFNASDAVIFHNRDDHRHLASFGVIPENLPVHIVSGSGVDLAHYTEAPLPPLSGGLVFLMIARLTRYKGVEEYCEAARLLKERGAGARFLLVGPGEDGPAGLPKAELERYRGIIEYLGPTDDVRPSLAQCHVYVLPSYGEGMPRTVLEALATGRPVITTDTRGCRETVDERVNGILVPIRDASALAKAMESMLRRPDLIPAMAHASRLKAERRFDVALVNRDMLAALGFG